MVALTVTLLATGCVAPKSAGQADADAPSWSTGQRWAFEELVSRGDDTGQAWASSDCRSLILTSLPAGSHIRFWAALHGNHSTGEIRLSSPAPGGESWSAANRFVLAFNGTSRSTIEVAVETPGALAAYEFEVGWEGSGEGAAPEGRMESLNGDPCPEAEVATASVV